MTTRQIDTLAKIIWCCNASLIVLLLHGPEWLEFFAAACVSIFWNPVEDRS
jgi:hypothetical protein